MCLKHLVPTEKKRMLQSKLIEQTTFDKKLGLLWILQFEAAL